jgi:hypothetical protein
MYDPVYLFPAAFRSALMAREKTARLVHLPSSENDSGVVADVKRHLMFNVGALTHTFTVPAPLQFPDMDFENAVSSAGPSQQLRTERRSPGLAENICSS